MILRITGGTSILELYEDQIVLRPTVDSDDRPTKTIPLDQVSMIWVSRSFFRTPYLQVVTPDLVRTTKPPTPPPLPIPSPPPPSR